MFKKIIKYLLDVGGYTEESLATALTRSQSTINRIKQGQMPKWDDGEALKGLYDKALAKAK